MRESTRLPRSPCDVWNQRAKPAGRMGERFYMEVGEHSKARASELQFGDHEGWSPHVGAGVVHLALTSQLRATGLRWKDWLNSARCFLCQGSTIRVSNNDYNAFWLMWLKNTTNTRVNGNCCCKVYTIRSQRAQFLEIAWHPADNTPNTDVLPYRWWVHWELCPTMSSSASRPPWPGCRRVPQFPCSRTPATWYSFHRSLPNSSSPGSSPEIDMPWATLQWARQHSSQNHRGT